MDYRLILALIVAVLIKSSVAVGSYGTEETHLGFHDRFRRQAVDQQCIPLSRPTVNHNQLFQFRETFAKLNAGMANISSASGDVIMFVGNTGSGKSSLVHLLAGNTENFFSEDEEGTGNYRIVDLTNKFVSRTTTDSMTTYPEAIMDAESGVLLYDSPGFRDTRSAIHELVATYGLQTVAKNSKRIKFALLVDYNSLTATGSRDDFTNALQSYFSLLQNPQKFTTYLVATKVENRYIMKKGHLQLVSDDTFVNGTVNFLQNVQKSLGNQKKNMSITNSNKRQFLSQAQLFIEDLINNQERIMLFRKPDEGGPIMDSATIRQSLATIRQSLLNTKHFVNVNVDDFGYTLSDKAKIYIREIFDLTNNYIIEVVKLFTKSFEQFLVAKYKEFVDITEIINSLADTKRNVDVLIQSANTAQTPDKFAEALWRFVDSVGADTCSNDTLKEIKHLTEFHSNVENITDGSLYAPSKWADSLFGVERIVKSKQGYYVMLNNLFAKLTDHDALTDDFFVGTSLALKKYDTENTIVDERHYPVLMNVLGLNQFADLKIDQGGLKKVHSIYQKAKDLQSKSNVSCTNNTLVILGNFLQLQTLDKKKIEFCKQATTVALLATNKIYIDTNIGVDVLGGRNLVIIAPEWQVVGKFTLSVDGASQGVAQSQAANGTVGMDGRAGQSAGNFIGVGLHYYNSKQLTITANGGNGQDGQAGGDGVDGKHGFDGKTENATQVGDYSLTKTYIYNSNLVVSNVEADKGTKGGDAGMGGHGGAGGFKGSVEMHSLSKDLPDGSTHEMYNGREGLKGANGKKGHGGSRGCDIAVEEYKSKFLGYFNSYKYYKKYIDGCVRRNPDGDLISNEAEYSERPKEAPNPPKICELYKFMSSLFPEMDNMFSHKLFEKFQDAFNKKFHCT